VNLKNPRLKRFLLLHEVCYNIDMKLKRSHAKLCKMTDADNGYVEASPAERVGLVWEITKELWSLRNRQDAEQILQRNVATLIRPDKEQALNRS
jgi:hypothetical protein